MGQDYHEGEIKGVITYNDEYLASFDSKSVILWNMKKKILINKFHCKSDIKERDQLDPLEMYEQPSKKIDDLRELFAGIKFISKQYLVGWSNSKIMLWNVEQGYLEKEASFWADPSKYDLSDAYFAFEGIIFKDEFECRAYYIQPNLFGNFNLDQDWRIQDNSNDSQKSIKLECNDTAVISKLYIIKQYIFGLTNKNNLFLWNFEYQQDQLYQSTLVNAGVIEVKQYDQQLWYLQECSIIIIEDDENQKGKFIEYKISLNNYSSNNYTDFLFVEEDNLIYVKGLTFVTVWRYNKDKKSAEQIIQKVECTDIISCKDSPQLYYVEYNHNKYLLAYSKIQGGISPFYIDYSNSSQISLQSQKFQGFDNKVYISSQFIYTYGEYIKIYGNNGQGGTSQFSQISQLGRVAESKIYSQNFESIVGMITTNYNPDLYYSLQQNTLIGWSLKSSKAVFSLLFPLIQLNIVGSFNILCTTSVQTLQIFGQPNDFKTIYSIIMIRENGFYLIGEKIFEYNKDSKSYMIYKNYLIASSKKMIRSYFLGDIQPGNPILSSDKDQNITEKCEFQSYFNKQTGHIVQVFSSQNLITKRYSWDLQNMQAQITIPNLNQCEMFKYQEYTSSLIILCTSLNQILILDNDLQIIKTQTRKSYKNNTILGLYYQKDLNLLAYIDKDKFGVIDLDQNVETFINQGSVQTINIWEDFCETGKIFIYTDYRNYMIIDMYNYNKITLSDKYVQANILKKIYYDNFNDRIFYIYQNKTIQHQTIENTQPIKVKIVQDIPPFESNNLRVFLQVVNNFVIVANSQLNKIRIFDLLQDTSLLYNVEFNYQINRISIFSFRNLLLLLSQGRKEIILLDLTEIQKSPLTYTPQIFLVDENQLSNKIVFVDTDNFVHRICFFDWMKSQLTVYSFPDIVKLYSIDIKKQFPYFKEIIHLGLDIIQTEIQILVVDSDGKYYIIFYNYMNQTSQKLTLTEALNELIVIDYSHLYIVGVFRNSLKIFLRASGELYQSYQPSSYTILSYTYTINSLFHMQFSTQMGVALDFSNLESYIFKFQDWPEQLIKFICTKESYYVLMIEMTSISIAQKDNGELVFRYRMEDESNIYKNFKYIEEINTAIVQFQNNLIGFDLINLKLLFDIVITPLSGQFLFKLDVNMILFCNSKDGSLVWLRYNTVEKLKELNVSNNQQLRFRVNSTYYLLVDDKMNLWKFQTGQNQGYVFIKKFQKLILKIILIDNKYPVFLTQKELFCLNIENEGLYKYSPDSSLAYFIYSDVYLFEIGINYINKITIYNGINDSGNQILFQVDPIYIEDKEFKYGAQIEFFNGFLQDNLVFAVIDKSKIILSIYGLIQKQENTPYKFSLTKMQDYERVSSYQFVVNLSSNQMIVATQQALHKIQYDGGIKTVQTTEFNWQINQIKYNEDFIFMLCKKVRKIVVINKDTLKIVFQIYSPALESKIEVIPYTYLIAYSSTQINFYDVNTLQLKNIQQQFTNIKIIYFNKNEQYFIIKTGNSIHLFNFDFTYKYRLIIDNPKVMEYSIIQQQGISIFNVKLLYNSGLQSQTVNLLNSTLNAIENCYLVFNSEMKKYEQQQVFERTNYGTEQLNDQISRNTITINYYLDVYTKSFIVDEISSKPIKIRFRLFPSQNAKSDDPSNLISIQLDSIQQYRFQIFYLKQFKLTIPLNNKNIIHNSSLNEIVWQDIFIKDQNIGYTNGWFQYDSQSLFLIKSLTIQNITSVGQNLFLFSNQLLLRIHELKIINSTLSYRALFQFNDSTQVVIDNLIIEDVSLSTASLFNFNNVQFVFISNVYIKSSKSFVLDDVDVLSDSQENYTKIQNSFFDVKGVNYLNMENIYMSQIKNISLLNSQNVYSSNSYNQELKKDIINLNNFIIENNSLSDEIIFVKANQFYISNSTFINNTCLTCFNGGIFNFFQTISNLLNIRMINNTAINGGVIFAQKNSFLYINEDTFIFRNLASAFGGAVYLLESFLYIQDSVKLTNNSANIGGGIYVPDKNGCKYILKDFKNNIFNNSALIFGDNCGSNPSQIKLFSTDKTIQIQKSQNEQNFTINEFMSGGTVKISLQLLDEENQVVKIQKYSEAHGLVQQFLQKIKIIIMSQKVEIKLSGSMILNYQNTDKQHNTWVFEEVNIRGIPQSQGNIIIFIEGIFIDKTENGKQVSSVLLNPQQEDEPPNNSGKNDFLDQIQYISININFRQCLVGEILLEDYIYKLCFPCPNGFYSLQEPRNNNPAIHQCQKCPESARNCSGKQIDLKNGYWRKNDSTDSILHCYKNPSSCQGENQDSKFYCKRGFVGPLCESCDVYGNIWKQKYFKDKQDCIQCNNISGFKYYTPIFIIFFLMIIYIVYSIKIASIVTVDELQLLNIFSFLPNIISLPVENFVFSFDCLFTTVSEQTLSIIFFRIIWIFILPLIYFLAIGLVYGFMILLKKNKFNKFFLSNGLFFLILFIQPNIISSLLTTVFCRRIEDKLYILADTQYECLTQTHLQSIAIISIPSLFLWIFIIPFGILFKLYKSKNKLCSISMRFNFGFLYQEFTPKFYFWEFVKIYMKIIIVILHITFQNSIYIKLSLIGIILLIYQTYSKNYRPYRINRFNRVDRLLTIGLVLLIFLNISYQEINKKTGKIIWMVINIGVYYAFLVYLIYIVIKSKLMYRFQQPILKIKRRMRDTFPRILYWIDTTEPINTIRAHKNWMKVNNIIKNKSYQQIQLINYGLNVDQEQNQIKRKSTSIFLQKKNQTNPDIDKNIEQELINIDSFKAIKQDNNQNQIQSYNYAFQNDMNITQIDIKQDNQQAIISSNLCSNNFLFMPSNQQINNNEQQFSLLNQGKIDVIGFQQETIKDYLNVQLEQKQPSLEQKLNSDLEQQARKKYQSLENKQNSFSPNSPNRSLLGHSNEESPQRDFSYYQSNVENCLEPQKNMEQKTNDEQILQNIQKQNESQIIQLSKQRLQDLEQNNRDSTYIESGNQLNNYKKQVLRTQNTISSISTPLINIFTEQNNCDTNVQITQNQVDDPNPLQIKPQFLDVRKLSPNVRMKVLFPKATVSKSRGPVKKLQPSLFQNSAQQNTNKNQKQMKVLHQSINTGLDNSFSYNQVKKYSSNTKTLQKKLSQTLNDNNSDDNDLTNKFKKARMINPKQLKTLMKSQTIESSNSSDDNDDEEDDSLNTNSDTESNYQQMQQNNFTSTSQQQQQQQQFQ